MPETPSDDAPVPLPINGAGNGGTVIAEANEAGSISSLISELDNNQVGVTAALGGSEDEE